MLDRKSMLKMKQGDFVATQLVLYSNIESIRKFTSRNS